MTVAPFPVKSDATAADATEQPLVTAPLANVSLFAELAERVTGRHRGLPGMAVWYGPSGYGKTRAAIYGANRFRATYVEVGATWTQAKFCRALLTQLGLPPTGTVADMAERIIDALRGSRRPVIIDEFDHVVTRKYVDLVREIHDQSGAAIILIGEEMLPHKLKLFERFHNRVLDWCPAQPCDGRDAGILVGVFAPGIAVAADLLTRIVKESGGRPRRIAVNLDRVREYCELEGLDAIDVARWGSRPLFSGEPPARRA
ncbi:ATP-binding protein [Azospirillum cavernae]|uniref:ATP-binding protein n=1 Tax=Azospirillum cavernae TaxID=2320860 RepID=A0A418W483_9PROT|nr:ATP-binding protein [Azospirillum cavernae]RJF84843.1 ATP-binding protein [Azospirillum cavernae]